MGPGHMGLCLGALVVSNPDSQGKRKPCEGFTTAPPPCLDISLREEKMYKSNSPQEVSVMPKGGTFWRRGWRTQRSIWETTEWQDSLWPLPEAPLPCYRSRLHHSHPCCRAVGVGNTWSPESEERFHFTFPGIASQGCSSLCREKGELESERG